MQPLSTYDLYLNIIVAVVMPLLIVANLTGRAARNPMNDYLWREHARFMWLSLFIIGLLSLWSIAQLAGHFGLITGGMVDILMPVIGIPFLIAAVAEIWMAIRLAVQYLRSRGSAA
jgi:hypothetical protein